MPVDHAPAAASMPRASCSDDQALEASSDYAMMPVSNPLGNLAAAPVIDTFDGTATAPASAPAPAPAAAAKHMFILRALSIDTNFCQLLAGGKLRCGFACPCSGDAVNRCSTL